MRQADASDVSESIPVITNPAARLQPELSAENPGELPASFHAGLHACRHAWKRSWHRFSDAAGERPKPHRSFT
eukprot:904732-Pyramimonas_sp.AAC.1